MNRGYERIYGVIRITDLPGHSMTEEMGWSIRMKGDDLKRMA